MRASNIEVDTNSIYYGSSEQPYINAFHGSEAIAKLFNDNSEHMFFVTFGLIDACETEDEFAAILAHEKDLSKNINRQV